MLNSIKSKFRALEHKIRSYYFVNRKIFEREMSEIKAMHSTLRESIARIETQVLLQSLESGEKFSFSHTGGGEITSFYLPYARFDLIQRCILSTRDFFDIDTIKKADKYLKDGAKILDIGANIGNNAIYYALIRKAAQIHAFEPQKDIFEILCKNIELNALQERVKPYNAALGRSNGFASIKNRPADNIGGTSIQSDESGDLVLKRLDDFAFSDIDFVKMDVEGFEADVLLGGEAFFATNKPALQIEIFPEKFDVVDGILRDFGYKLAEQIGGADFIYLAK